MAAKEPMSIREFLEAAIEFSGINCPVCKDGGLQLVWLEMGDDPNEPAMYYIECLTCHSEVEFYYTFRAVVGIPEGR